MPIFTSYSALVDSINSKTSKAIENACNRLVGHLKDIIGKEYYDVYTPKAYKRTYQFLESVTTQLVTKSCGIVYMNPEAMRYKEWTGFLQIEAANEGSHGGWVTPETVKHRYWDVFMDFCEKNAVNILKEELKKQGINVI